MQIQKRKLLLAGLALGTGLPALAAEPAKKPKEQCSVCDKPSEEELARGAKPATEGPQMVKPPVIWDGKKMHETFAAADAKGNAFHYPGPADRKKAYVAFDAQCPDCDTLAQALLPLYDFVDVAWFPIAYLNIHSEPQGAQILAAKSSWEKMEEHHEHFRDKGFRGLKYNASEIPESFRNKVWENTKMHRRCGCRAVPYGVFLNSKGVFMAFDETLKTQDLVKLFELK